MQIHFELIARALEASLDGKLGIDAYNVVIDYIQQPNQTFLDYINKLYYVNASISGSVYKELHNLV